MISKRVIEDWNWWYIGSEICIAEHAYNIGISLWLLENNLENALYRALVESIMSLFMNLVIRKSF